MTFDELARLLAEPGCRLLKIELPATEAELRQILDAAGGPLTKARPQIYLRTWPGPNAEFVMERLRANGYEVYWHRPAVHATSNFRLRTLLPADQIRSVNVFAQPAGTAAGPPGLEPVT